MPNVTLSSDMDAFLVTANDAAARNELGLGTMFNTSGAVTLPTTASPVYAAGKLVYDSDNESLTFYNNDNAVSLQIGQEEWIRVRNISGSTIPNGSAVYLNGANTGLPTIALAQANAAATTIGAGLTTEAIANNAVGYVTCIGVVNGLNTSAFTAGQTVFISATVAGGLTATAPIAPNYRYHIGIVGTVNTTTGTIHVTPSTAALGNGAANQVFGMNTAGTAQEVKTLLGTANEVTATAGANTITYSLPAALTFTGKIVTGGTFNGGAFNGTVGATTPNTVDATNVTVSGNLTLTGTGSRILAPLSSATPASRSVFQSSTVNTMTLVTAAPNGSNTTSGFEFHDSSALTGSIGSVYIDGTAVRIFSGGSVVKPIDIRLSTSTTARFYASGGVRIGTTLSDPGANNLSVQGIATVAGITDSGKVITPAGTTGARTINAMTGSVNFAAAASSLVVTNSLITVNSVVVCGVQGNDATMRTVRWTVAAGSITIYSNTAPTAETVVVFDVASI